MWYLPRRVLPHRRHFKFCVRPPPTHHSDLLRYKKTNIPERLCSVHLHYYRIQQDLISPTRGCQSLGRCIIQLSQCFIHVTFRHFGRCTIVTASDLSASTFRRAPLFCHFILFTEAYIRCQQGRLTHCPHPSRTLSVNITLIHLCLNLIHKDRLWISSLLLLWYGINFLLVGSLLIELLRCVYS